MDVEDMSDAKLHFLQNHLVEQLEIVEREIENRSNEQNAKQN